MINFKKSQHINGRTRFTLKVLGKRITGFYAKRLKKSRGFGIEKQRTFTQLHLGKRSLAFEVRQRSTHNFSG